MSLTSSSSVAANKAVSLVYRILCRPPTEIGGFTTRFKFVNNFKKKKKMADEMREAAEAVGTSLYIYKRVQVEVSQSLESVSLDSNCLFVSILYVSWCILGDVILVKAPCIYCLGCVLTPFYPTQLAKQKKSDTQSKNTIYWAYVKTQRWHVRSWTIWLKNCQFIQLMKNLPVLHNIKHNKKEQINFLHSSGGSRYFMALWFVEVWSANKPWFFN